MLRVAVVAVHWEDIPLRENNKISFRFFTSQNRTATTATRNGKPHFCTSKASKKIAQNINCHHHNANDRFELNPNWSLGCYAQICFLFVICFTAFRLQWNPIAPSNQQNIYSKIKNYYLISLMTDLG